MIIVILYVVLVIVGVVFLRCAEQPALSKATEDLLRAVAQDKNMTPRMIQDFIKLGADVNAKDKGGMTALMVAAALNNPEVILALVRAGADMNAKNRYGMTALMLAAVRVTAFNGNPEVIHTLLKAGADIFAKDNNGQTVLDYAGTYAIKRLILNAAQ